MSEGHVRILLSKAASDALTASGENCFSIVHRVMRGVEEPETAGRWAISLIPAEMKLVDDAVAVLEGRKRAVKVSTTRARPRATRRPVEDEGPGEGAEP